MGRDSNGHFFREDTETAHEDIKQMLNVTNHWEKARQNYDETPLVTITTVSKTENNKYWQGCEEAGALVHRWRECKMALPLWKIA